MSEWHKAWKKPIQIKYREVTCKEEIKTNEGVLFAYPDQDYVICGVEGEIYPIKKNIFEKTYTTEPPQSKELEQRLEECEKEFARQLERLSDLKTKEKLKRFLDDVPSVVRLTSWFERLREIVNPSTQCSQYLGQWVSWAKEYAKNMGMAEAKS